MVLEESFVGMTGIFSLDSGSKEMAGWGWSSVGRVLVYHAGNPVLDPIPA